MGGGRPIRPVHDHIPVITKGTVTARLTFIQRLQRTKPILLDNDDEIPDIHVRHHTLGFDRNECRPRATDKKNGKSNSSDHADHPEKVTEEHDPRVGTPAQYWKHSTL